MRSKLVVLEILERVRLVLRDVDADLVHHRDGERIGLDGPHAGRGEVDLAAEVDGARSPSAIGERTALNVQANRSDCGRRAAVSLMMAATRAMRMAFSPSSAGR